MKEMKLGDFVAGVISEIVDGVASAQAHARELGARVNPVLYGKMEPGFYYYDDASGENHYGQLVAFDVSVTTAESEEAKGGIGLFAASLGLGAQAQVEGSRSDVARIQFSVPVVFPIQK